MNPNPVVMARRMILAVSVGWTGLVATSGTETAPRWATLEAIHQLENPRELLRPGSFGELGAYQFRRTTWEMHTNLPFGAAVHRATSDQVAVRHYEWLKRELEKAGRPATVYNIALAWNGGLRAVTPGRAPRVALDYAQRAVNLADALVKDQAVVTTKMQ